MPIPRFLFLWLSASTILLSSCFTPYRKFEKVYCPAAPDYSRSSSWAALPDKKDSADAHPIGTTDEQANARVDVFFIHPTTYILGHHWNGGINWKGLNKLTDKGPIRNQASVFNGSCKVYAPRYRQAKLSAYMDTRGNGPKAFDTAYADVRKAFQYYLEHYNQGRPIIIASHSQGTDHAMKLVREFFENDPVLSSRLVACYLIGRPITHDSLKHSTPCDSAGQTGCYVSWNTLHSGVNELFFAKPQNLICVNPLSWKRDTLFVSADKNLGSLQGFGKAPIKKVIDARCTSSGVLWVHVPLLSGYPQWSSYHIYDYNFYYMNIRENVKERVDAYFKQHP
ncbi:MAG TPA: DUF3089 domain-containing protein [Bacteroidia bacterium]|jgi:hypothetical protein|nr:DUF3089 domain-containing protein [Bacteroidia bacterium]